jgi:hypothetical protein
MPRDLPTGTVTFLFTVFAAAELAILAADAGTTSGPGVSGARSRAK